MKMIFTLLSKITIIMQLIIVLLSHNPPQPVVSYYKMESLLKHPYLEYNHQLHSITIMHMIVNQI